MDWGVVLDRLCEESISLQEWNIYYKMYRLFGKDLESEFRRRVVSRLIDINIDCSRMSYDEEFVHMLKWELRSELRSYQLKS